MGKSQPVLNIILLLMVWQHQEREKPEGAFAGCGGRGRSRPAGRDFCLQIFLSPWHVSRKAKGKGRARRWVFCTAKPVSRVGLEASQEKPSHHLALCAEEVLIPSPKPPEVRVERTPRANQEGEW